MRRLLVTPLIFIFLSPVKAGIYFYPDYQDGIEVRCKDGRPKHLVEITKAGRGMKLEGHGDDQYSWPIIYIYPEAPDEKYKYFPNTSGTACSYRTLDEKEKNSLIINAFKTCFGTDVVLKERIEIREKYCFGWN